jgi:hypothetical protein
MPLIFDPRDGFGIEEPAVFVSWGVDEAELAGMFAGELKKVTGGYYTMPCVSLSGLRHQIGFHFSAGRLTIFEFFPQRFPDDGNWRLWFDEFDQHLRQTFGLPTRAGADRSEWDFGSVGVKHYMIERFGPEVRTYLCRLDGMQQKQR